jgi:antitoxin component YwqK of YwqJK toxin-antitoxin module
LIYYKNITKIKYSKFLLSLFILVFTLLTSNVFSIALLKDSAVSTDGFVKFYHSNGKVSSEGLLQAGKPNGYWKTFYPNGTIKSEGNRLNFELDSVWKFYTEKGTLISEFNYSKGKKNGYKRTFDTDSNRLLVEEHFVNDLKQGFSFYYKNNFKFKQVPFIDGKESGLGKEFNKDGIIITLTTYKNGFVSREEKINRTDRLGKKNGLHKTFFEGTDREKIVCTYSDDKLDGYLKEFNLKGDLIRTEKWVNGVLQKNAKELVKLDSKKEFYENGKLKLSGTLKQGVLEGVMRFYDSSGVVTGSKLYNAGVVVAEGIYDERGLQQGPWKEFYATGELKAEGLYEMGKKIGLWKYFHVNGKPEQTGKYFKGKPDGTWKWFYESGNILREETFEKGIPVEELREFSDSGKVIIKGSFLDGEPDGFWFLEDNDFKEEGIFKAGVKYDEWKCYYLSTGKLQHKGKYVDGQENGKHIFYYDNGRICDEGDFIMGQRDGKWKHFDIEGNLLSVMEYKNGEDFKVDGMNIPFNRETSVNNEEINFIVKPKE